MFRSAGRAANTADQQFIQVERSVHERFWLKYVSKEASQRRNAIGRPIMKILMIATAAATVATMAIPATPAEARDRYYERDYRDYRQGNYRVYDNRGRYVEPRRVSRNDRVWRGNDGRYYCQRSNGTTGLLIGAGVGALAGHQIAGHRDKTLGAIVGGALGAALGREIDRGNVKCR